MSFLLTVGEGGIGSLEDDGLLKRTLDVNAQPVTFVIKRSTGAYCTTYHESGSWFLILLGPQPASAQPDWTRIETELEATGKIPHAAFPAPHVFIAINRRSGHFWARTDRRAQYPLFVQQQGSGLALAADLGWLVRAGCAKQFNPDYLSEFITFNYPLLDTTWLKGVTRVAPDTCLHYDAATGSLNSRVIAAPRSRDTSPLRGREELDFLAQTFRNVVQDYQQQHSRLFISLTGGMDSQCILASVSRKAGHQVHGFTYGYGNTADVVYARQVADRYEVPHHWIGFEGHIPEQLPELLIDTLRVSGGLEQIRRGILPFVYDRLKQEAEPDLVLSGVSGDHVFRDHLKGSGNVPSIIASALMDYIHGSRFDAPDDVLGPELAAHANKRLNDVNEAYGEIRSAQSYVSFLMKECAVKYFGGEAAVARNYLPFASIYWDDRIVDLIYRLQRSTIGLSEMYPNKDSFRESCLQAHVIRHNSGFSDYRIKGINLSCYVEQRVPRYKVNQAVNRIRNRVDRLMSRRQYRAAENWKLWISKGLMPLIQTLFDRSPRLAAYLDEERIRSTLASGDSRLLAKFLHLELLLRLIESGWDAAALKRDLRDEA